MAQRFLLSLSGRGRLFIFCLLLLLATGKGYTQTGCNCPAVASCSPCAGGLTSLVLNYTGGGVIVTVTATDDDGLLSASLLSSTITITKTPANTPFNGNVNITVVGVGITGGTATIVTSCAVPVQQGSVFGNFTVVSGASLGGPLCCSSTDQDQTAPTFNTLCPADIQRYVTAGTCSATATWTAPTATDNCGSTVTLSSTHNPGATFPLGITTVTYTAKDVYNNATTCSFNVEVIDNIAPVIACPSSFDVYTVGNCRFVIPDYTSLANATDNCTTVTVTQSPAVSTILSGLGTVQLITLTATDGSGNTSSCGFNITLKDNIAPVITCPGNRDVFTNASCQFTIPDYTGTATTNDNCGATVVQTPAVGTVLSGVGTTQIIKLTATDGSGNSSNCSFTITLKDNTPPVINCPANRDVFTNANCQFVLPDYTTLATSSDNCDNSVTITQSPAIGTIISGTNQTITLTATDDSNNTATCTFVITLKDNIPPVIACPADFDVSLNASCQFAIPDYTNQATASDNCDNNVTVTQSPVTGTLLNGAGITQLITLTATDDAGNTSSCSFNITTKDTTPPVISCPTDRDVTPGANCSFTIPDYTALASATDNCNVAVTQSPLAGTVITGAGMQQIITLTATDGTGNTASCTFTITLKDDVTPVINCPADRDEFTDANCNFTIPDYTTLAIASDNCSFFVTQSPVAGTIINGSGITQPITLTATDVAGNTSNCTFNIQIKDNIAPVITNCPVNITVSTSNNSCDALVSWTTPTAADNCDNPSITSTHSSGSLFSLGSTTVTYTATDASGNTTSCSFTVQVVDDVKPVLSGCPSDITVNAETGCQATVTWNSPTATDNCGIPTLISDFTSGSLFPSGSTKVTYEATDAAGNKSTCSFNVIVKDLTPPVFSGCVPDITITAEADCNTTVTWTEPTANDDCSTPVVTSSHHPGDEFNTGTTLVTYTAIDIAGNTSTCSFKVIVVDQVAPVITCVNDITTTSGSTCGATVTWTAPIVTDCSTVTISSIPAMGSFFAVGTTNVIYTATDAQGNTATCTFKVTVEDKTKPVFANCITEVKAKTDQSCKAIVNWVAPVATDNCSTPIVTASHLSGSSFDVGTTLVTYTAMDAAGNTSQCQFNVVVTDGNIPVISNCPVDQSLEADESGQVTASWTEPTASVFCGTTTLTSTHKPGDAFSIGANEVTYTATSNAGNSATCTFYINVAYEELEYEVTQLVTPNGDGVNDILEIKNIESFKDNKVTIVDRWGGVIYTATGYNNGSVSWSGTNAKGGNAPTGTYFYTITVKFRDQTVDKKGFIELVR